MVLSIWMLECCLASDLDCSYSYDNGGRYTCLTMNLKLEKDNKLIESVKGQHLPGKEQINVEGLLIVFSRNKFLSSDIFKKFPNLKVLNMWYYTSATIVKGNFEGAQHLEQIHINNHHIEELSDNIFSGATKLVRIEMKMNGITSISSQTFAGLTTLQYIDLDHNHLKSLPKGLLNDLIHLKYVSFFGNILESIDGDLLKNNLELTFVSFSNNFLSVIGSNLIKQHKKLILANFNNNHCISSSLHYDTKFDDLNENIAKCTKSNKPEQMLIMVENEKKELIGKIDSLNENIIELKTTNTIQLQENDVLKQNLEVLQHEVQVLNKVNKELNMTIAEQLHGNKEKYVQIMYIL